MVEPTKLEKSQHLLWSLLSDDERIKHKMAYRLALSNLENGIQETILAGIIIAPNAPAALFFSPDTYDEQCPNIVGRVLDESKGLVQFRSKDLIELLEIYYSKNLLNA